MTPDLAEVIRRAIEHGIARVHTSIPARVVSYDAARQTATVQITIRSRFRNADGQIVTFLPPPIPNVPVQFPSGGGCSLTWPLVEGDPVLLVFAERSIDEWRAQSGDDHEPSDPRRFDLSDAVALAGVRSPADPLPADAVHASDVVIRGNVRLGSAEAADLVALASKVEAALSALKAAIDGAAVGASDGGLAFKTNLMLALSDWPPSVSASKVRAE